MGTTTQYDITGGTRPGGENGTNLFHSFGDFGVPPNSIANFLNGVSFDLNGHPLTPGLPTSNILARVTGTDGNHPTLSSIYGAIQTTDFGSANLFLMNPAGFLFGPNATVNVGGMMVFTTADYMRLSELAGSNAGIFHADTAQTSILTSAPVAAFGFIGSSPQAIDFKGGQLTVANGTGVTLVAGDINLLPDSSGTPSSITASGKPILFTSVAGTGEVAADTVMPASGMTLGTITLGQGTVLSTAGDPSIGDGSGGTVSIRGGQLVATGASIVTNPADDSTGQGGIVMIATTGSVSLTNSAIDTSSASIFSAGSSAAVNITASDLTLQHSSIYTRSGGGFFPTTGSGGAVTLRGTNISLTGSSIDTQAVESTGNAGPVTIKADQTVMIVGSLPRTPTIDTSTLNTSEDPTVAGHGGNIEITGTNVTLTDSAKLQSVADGLGTFSQGGNILITGSENVVLNNGTTLLTTTVSEAPAGNIELLGQHVTISQSSFFSNTLSPGAAGSITITGTGDITLNSGTLISTNAGLGSDGSAGPIEINTQHLTIAGGSQVSSKTFGSSPGGNVIIQGTSGPAQSVLISDPGSGIFTDTLSTNLGGNILGTGAGGSIFVHANSVMLQNGGMLSAKTTGAGNAGDILVKADSVSITGGAQFTSSSSLRQTPFFDGEVIPPPTGNAGNVTIQGLASPAQSVLIDGPGSGISTNTVGTGAGGNIFVNANSVTLQNGGTLSAATSGTASSATGGTITVKATQVELNAGTINASTGGSGDAGAIHINATDRIALTDGAIIASASENLFSNAQGNGGTITLHAPHITISGEALVSSSTSGPGNAGDVVLETQSLIMSGVGTQGGRVIADTQGPGQGGNITVQGLEGPESAAEVVELIHGSLLFAKTTAGAIETDAQGNAGSIHVRAATLVLDGASQLSTTSDTSTGGAGTIIVDATDSVHLSGSSSITSTSADAFGQAGDITITSPTIWLKGASFISTSTDLVGNAGNITLHTQALSLTEGSQLTSNSGPQRFPEFLSGSAGSVRIQNQGSPAQSVLIDGPDSGIFTDTQGTGAGGDIFVNANSVTLQNGGVLSAVTSGTTATATGGTITVEANQVQLNNGGLITASTTGAGAGGSITIGAGNIFTSNASTVSSTATQAQGGDINITAGQSATLNNGSSISASSTGEGDAGDIDINAGQTFLATNSSVTTQANQASGGAIKITTNPSGTVELTNSLISASVLNGTGGGGSVNIDPLYVLMQNSQILAQAVQGPGGNITINITNGGLFLPDANSTISASSQLGVNGTVTIQSPNAPTSGQIQPLGKSPLIATSLLNQRCASLAGGEFSSFTVAGRDSLPTEPGSWLASPLALSPAGSTVGTVTIGGDQTHVVDPANETTLLSLRQIAPAGFLTQAFATDSSIGCS
ncbi:hypothetical protein AYO43_01815 [Nitrospira sp. SCGC AG-212-E16]|nr:hypothetical protein AYO43_01815 [Nitrospira sp. SCGC AG-212-E16]